MNKTCSHINCRFYNPECSFHCQCGYDHDTDCTTYETRQSHAQKLLDQLNKILDEACKCCVNHFDCYRQKKNGELRKIYKKCSQISFERKLELIGDRCVFHPILNPKGYRIRPKEKKSSF